MRRALAAVVLSLVLGASTAAAENKFSNPVLGAGVVPPAAREADLEEQLGRAVDPTLHFSDQEGRPVVLADVVRGDVPVVLVLAYYRCPMLCGLVLRGVVDAANEVSLHLGGDYRALTVSFDPRDTPEAARAKRASTLAALASPLPAPDAWPFLVGEARATRELAEEVGFRYAYDARTDQYAHPAAAIVLTPQGRVSRYLYGTTFSARDMRLALVEAGQGRTGTIVDRVILTCYHFDPATRVYGPFMVGFMRVGGALVLSVVVVLLGVLIRADRRRSRIEGGRA